MTTILRMTQLQHQQLQAHLFPGDGKEAAAIALCGRAAGPDRHSLMVRKIERIPYRECVRTDQYLTWPTERLLPLLAEAATRNLAILKIHSHPGGYEAFSELDDQADRELFSSVYGWVDSDFPHASAVMLPGGRMFGRWVDVNGGFHPLACIGVVGDDLLLWHTAKTTGAMNGAHKRNAQAFGAGTLARMQLMTAAVVGCSGTGSVVTEQLLRLGIGRLILIDPDHVGIENINRIPQATITDAEAKRLKVDVMRDFIIRSGLPTKVVALACDIASPEAVRVVAEADVVFGCMDGIEGRHLLNRLTTFYSLPYFDVGVKLIADGTGGIEQICGTVHYLQPGRSSLLSRGVYTLEELRAAWLKKTDPAEYEAQLRSKYIIGAQEGRPAVISVNMQFASLAVNEFLARLHPYRDDDNSGYATYRMSLTQGALYMDKEGAPCTALAPHVGRGDVKPLLDSPYLGDAR